MIVAIVVTVLIALLVILVITNLISKSRNAADTHYYGDPDASIHHVSYLGQPGDVDARGHGGDWGGRDMSHDHHTDASDHGGGGDWGGDAGGGDGGGGGE